MLHERTNGVVRITDYAHMSVAAFDERWDGESTRSLLGICSRATSTLLVFAVERREDSTMGVKPVMHLPALTITTIRGTRDFVADLLLLKPDGTLCLLVHGTFELPLAAKMPAIAQGRSTKKPNGSHIVGLAHAVYSSVSLELSDGSIVRTSLDLIPRDHLVCDCLVMLSFVLPPNMFLTLHWMFLSKWAAKDYAFIIGVEFDILVTSLLQTLGLETEESVDSCLVDDVWGQLVATESFDKFQEDPVLRKLQLPGRRTSATWRKPVNKPHSLVGAVLHALHLVAEEKRVFLPQKKTLPNELKLVRQPPAPW